ncbi:MAG TPA: YXWGXW repeat-containing protein [Bryobacteraceae bacterium]|nr:YXWGXW repeat-containing protein [Bryobacteraceae bacterium]
MFTNFIASKKFIGLVFAGVLAGSSAMAAEVIIRVAPPRPIVETRVVRPGPGYIWIGGYHRWDGGRYVWVPGRWELPPRAHAHWVAHRYVHRNGGWVFVEGRWR